MASLKDIENLEERVVFKCDCGHYHDEKDVEIVVVKMVKGKDCKIEAFEKPPNYVVPSVTAEEPSTEEIPPKQQPPRRNIIPPGIASMMMPPGSPNFETRGAKEVRRA